MFAPESLKQFDAIVLNNASGAWITPTAADLAKEPLKKLGADAAAVEAALRKGFLAFVENGGGVVSLHYAIAANRHWPEFKELFGAAFTGHPWNEQVGVTVEEPGHPLAAAFGGKDFLITDEIYLYGPPYDRSKVRVLMSIDPARTNMGARWLNRKENDFALTWVKSYGKGRVFNTSFGHRTELFFDPQILQFYLDAVQFTTGDLAAPIEPRASRPERANVPGTQPAPGLEPGFCLALRRPFARRLGGRPHDLDGRGRRYHGPDDRRDEAQGEQLPHLERPGRELRVAAKVPARRGQFGHLLSRPETPSGADAQRTRSSARRPTSTPRAAGLA